MLPHIVVKLLVLFENGALGQRVSPLGSDNSLIEVLAVVSMQDALLELAGLFEDRGQPLELILGPSHLYGVLETPHIPIRGGYQHVPMLLMSAGRCDEAKPAT